MPDYLTPPLRPYYFGSPIIFTTRKLPFNSPIDALLTLQQTVIDHVSADRGRIFMVAPKDLINLALWVFHPWLEVLDQVF
jgi:hypothetical protein